MKIAIISFLVIICGLLSPSIFAYEGPYLSEGVPVVRASEDGDLTVFGLPASANCHKNKANLFYSSYHAGISNMVLSIVLAAQTSGKSINIWVDRYYNNQNQERCSLSFIEMVN